ncbi:iron-containing alcohol dehydrogenase [Streptomyces sp. NPDC051976]|uniref:iron-containing alcohol dehydrogenase family protein n=1 Tax=Streptomyces sp. NPDC051976 TaxID=3154947 RepID=UPI0034168101
MTSLTFATGTRIITGLGALRELPDEIGELGTRRLVAVLDRSLVEHGVLDVISAADGELDTSRIVLVDPDPGVSDAERAAEQALAWNADSVLAVGGGSALCAAKAIAIRLTNPGPLLDYEGTGKVPNRPAPTIAVPTTAGSGGEVSNALVLHEPGRDREIIIRGPGYEPTVAILDATLLAGLPRTPMLYAAIDALSHALEALWTRRRTSFTDSLAEHAAQSIFADLPRALEDREPETLQRLLEASCAANLACGNTGLGLVHALSCAPSVGLPHGYQNGALLLHVGQFNRDAMDKRHQAYLESAAGLFDAVAFPGKFEPNDLGPEAGAAMLAASRSHVFRANNVRDSADSDISTILAAAGVPPAVG